MRLSILVVSRTADRLSAMLESIAEATELPSGEVEILCSWNGTNISEQKIGECVEGIEGQVCGHR